MLSMYGRFIITRIATKEGTGAIQLTIQKRGSVKTVKSYLLFSPTRSSLLEAVYSVCPRSDKAGTAFSVSSFFAFTVLYFEIYC